MGPLYSTIAPPTQQSYRMILWGLTTNISFAAIKIGGGLLGHSHALLADGLESLLDVLNSFLNGIAYKAAQQPPDAEHPYGHGKIESLAGIFGGGLLIFSGIIIGRTAFSQIASPPPQHPSSFTLLILIVVILIKGLLSQTMLRKNQELNSSLLHADAWHHRSDAMTSLAAFIGISLTLTGIPAFRTADNWAAIFSCGIIILNGVYILRNTAKEIMDARVSEDMVNSMLEVAKSIPGVKSVEKCRVRKSGVSLLADLHVRVNGDLSVREGHQISHNVIHHLLANDPRLRDITVHLEPD
ncbi:MAG: cation-efflux pump [Verrucomicrobia bacterium]|nr:MAG: cation-efflux pump [Verrucomicrobiota bacterium]